MQNTLLVIIIMLFTFQPSKPETFEPITVLELFTSQGCSSCPKADELLGNVKNKSNRVVALSYHVDYWNYIGWNDPFSNKYNTEKQREYGEKFYSSRIYTPQLVINGREHFVGSNSRTLNDKLEAYEKLKAKNSVTLSNIKQINKMINFNYSINGSIKDKKIRFILVIDERITKVKRGENRNRVIKNENIVVNEIIETIEDAEGEISIEIPKIVEQQDNLRIVAIIQTKTLDITGATQKTL
ncbi:thioredoxin family protein [uncultured Lacinutrix sp.]|uniref:DUF1223 domain-containing protein n=1 Tax=uncultured Lacinutrix sp. TaxID=574032 RepID=UPI00261B88E9|nr:DUF1223 domain-containing protein [uncultured Lacinutrix sp.]